MDMDTTILIIDDETDLRSCYSYLFRDWEIVFMDKPAEALKYLDRHRVDLIILDLRMPGMDGLEFYKRILRQGITTGVIIFSAISYEETQKTFIEMGARDYITKPIGDIGEFRERIKKALGK